MIKWAHDELSAHDFTATHANANTASDNVIRKCGFVFNHFTTYERLDGSEVFEASAYKMHID